MTDSLFKIAGGYVYDPINGLDGQVHDLWIQHGKIVPPPQDDTVRPARTLDEIRDMQEHRPLVGFRETEGTLRLPLRDHSFSFPVRHPRAGN